MTQTLDALALSLRRLAANTPKLEALHAAMQMAKDALEGDSNDDEFDALRAMAEALGINSQEEAVPTPLFEEGK
jgi:pyrroloquinoline quinone (PQQ) biosynthesis protein C